MTKRVEQVEKALHRAVAEVLRNGLADPRYQGFVSVTRVDVSPDLRNALVYVSVMPDKYVKRVLAALNHATRHLQKEVRSKLAMRIVPHLDFRYDEKLAKQNALLGAINEAVRRSGPAPAPGDDGGMPAQGDTDAVDPADEGGAASEDDQHPSGRV